jgi:predicted secreted Zn-dependent protease
LLKRITELTVNRQNRIDGEAQDLGLSAVEDPKVLRDHPVICKKTRKRVLKRLQAMSLLQNPAIPAES